MLAVFPPPRPSHIDASLALDIYLKINKTVTVLPILVFFFICIIIIIILRGVLYLFCFITG